MLNCSVVKRKLALLLAVKANKEIIDVHIRSGIGMPCISLAGTEALDGNRMYLLEC
jgi:hypothetical protein